ncbi:MAG: hypothetical protein B6I38_02830 [Anaerolineaceae bacterium 4572_5.1]|nr:MAG: hypothetical protein B6I38_02830 [Anaerolineaceae bacterium 4572_5.1]RLD04502.1 MAG: DUF952 domain-containing protein [Chloroflexota bacterium]
MNRIVHVCAPQAWEAAKKLGEYRAASLEGEGFIHCSTWEQISGVMNRFYADVEELLLLNIDPAKVTAEIRWEAVDGDEYPHLYGPLNLDAVVETIPFEMDIFGVHRRKLG